MKSELTAHLNVIKAIYSVGKFLVFEACVFKPRNFGELSNSINILLSVTNRESCLAQIRPAVYYIYRQDTNKWECNIII
jgi:hypothetical protein